MLILNENGFVTYMDDTIIYHSDNFEDEPSAGTRINPNVFFNPHSKYNTDLLMYECPSINSYIRLPITKYVCELFKNEIHEKVSFIFNDTCSDSPHSEDNVRQVDIHIHNTRDAINAYIQYITYRLINYLPYEDFAIDNVPTLEAVMIDDHISDFFDYITNYINDYIKHTSLIKIYKNGKYRFIYNSNNEAQHNKIENKKPMYIFIRVNDIFPIFYEFDKFTYQNIRKLNSIEVILSWYSSENKDYLSEYIESKYDEYLYSGNGLQSILTLDVTFGYLYSYYMNESKEITNNNFLIITIIGYYKISDGLVGIKVELHNKSFRKNSVINPIMMCYPAYKFLKE